MIPPHSLAALHLLHDESLPLLVFGTAGLELLESDPAHEHGPAFEVTRAKRLADRALVDVDLLLPGDPVAVRRAGTLLLEQGWALRSWDEPWDPSWSAEKLRGRWYLRATREDEQLDLTYECPFLDVPALVRQPLIAQGLPVCPLVGLWTVKLIKDEAAARALAEECGLRIPDESFAAAARWHSESPVEVVAAPRTES